MTSKNIFDSEVDDSIMKRWNLRPIKSLKKQSNASQIYSSSQTEVATVFDPIKSNKLNNIKNEIYVKREKCLKDCKLEKQEERYASLMNEALLYIEKFGWATIKQNLVYGLWLSAFNVII